MTAPSPRSYQLRAFAAVRDAWRNGHRRILLVAPTGTGKTFMGASLMAGHFRRTSEPRGVWVAHRRELVGQAARTLETMGLDPGHSGAGATKALQVIMAQGALARGEVPAAKFAVFDEAHHYCGAPEWETLPKAYESECTIIGLTATPERGDGAALSFFTWLIEVATTREMVDLWLETEGREGLVPCETFRPAAPEKAGCIAKSPAEAYMLAGLRGRKNVVFAANVADAERFAAEFRACGVSAHVVHGKLAKEERDARLNDFRSGSVDVLCNVYVLTEGWDCPAVSVITLASRCGSIGGLLQRVGRGRRPCDGKRICTILDLPGVTHILGDVDEERTLSLEGIGIQRKVASLYSYCRVCGSIMPAEGACESCGRPRDESALAEVSGNAIDKFASYKRDPEDQRAYRLAKWIAESKREGKNWKRNLYRYQAVYGDMPSGRIISLAHAVVNGTEWCGECGHGPKHCKCKKVA